MPVWFPAFTHAYECAHFAVKIGHGVTCLSCAFRSLDRKSLEPSGLSRCVVPISMSWPFTLPRIILKPRAAQGISISHPSRDLQQYTEPLVQVGQILKRPSCSRGEGK